MNINPDVAYRELMIQYDMLRQRNLILAQELYDLKNPKEPELGTTK